MEWTRKLSLRRKITLVIMINTFAALCAAGIAFAEYGVYRFKELRVEDLNALANILGTNSTAPLVFKDPNSAPGHSAGPRRQAAHPVRCHLRPERQALRVYHRGGPRDPYSPPPRGKRSQPVHFRSRADLPENHVWRRKSGQRVSRRATRSNTSNCSTGYLVFFGLIVAVVSLGAFVMAARLQRPISDPILQLAWTTKMVTGTQGLFHPGRQAIGRRSRRSDRRFQ